MQVFLTSPNPLDVAIELDPKRLNKQVLECTQILSALRGTSEAYKNHPVTLMYTGYEEWLEYYQAILVIVRDIKRHYQLNNLFLGMMGGLIDDINWITDSDFRVPLAPTFIYSEDLHKAHKCRLYHKDPKYYEQYECYKGFTDSNWYIIGGEVVKYKVPNNQLLEDPLE